MNKKFIGILLSLLLVLTVLVGFNRNVNAQGQDPEMPPVDQIIVKYKDGANLQQAAQAQAGSQMQRLNAAAGVTIDYFRPMSGDAHVMRLEGPVPVEQARAISARLEALPEVEYAEPDYIAYPLEADVTPNDQFYPQQWHYFDPATGDYGVNAPAAWNITKGASNIYIAVLDTGITDHADLAGRWVGGYDFVSDPFRANDGDKRDADPHDPGDWCDGYSYSSWHGTHVAGTIGAATNNKLGVAGLNWVSKIVPVRVLGKCGGSSSDIADGIRWAAGLSVSDPNVLNPYPARVINLSLGGYTPYGCAITYQNAINAAYNAGAVIVVSAGNDNIDASYNQPGNCDKVITVAATDRDGNKADYSNWGETVEISAPGNGVLSTSNFGETVPAGDAYGFLSGTSMAAPHVSGVVSLLLSLNPSMTPDLVLERIQKTATSISCTQCGSGIVNAGAALNAPPTIFPISNPYNDESYTVNWTVVPGAISYQLQEDDNFFFLSPQTLSNNSNTSYSFSGKSPGTWYYRVQSVYPDGASPWSSTVYTTVKPELPVLSAIDNPTNEDSYLISWSSQPGADGYILLEADNDFSGAAIKYQGADTSYLVTGQPGGTWYYKVRAYNGVAVDEVIYSDLSNLEVTSVTPSPLGEPTLEPIDNIDQDGDFTVKWTAVPTATSYILEMSDNQYFVDPVVVYNGQLTEKQVKNQAGGSWSYRVRAVSSTDQSAWSNSESTFVRYQVFMSLIFKDFFPTSDCTSDLPGESDTIDNALVICDGQDVHGDVSTDSEDFDDVYKIYAVKGQKLTATLTGLGGDADLYLFDPGSTDLYTMVASSKNRGSNDELISMTLSESGYWYIAVSSYSGTSTYTLSVELSMTSTSLQDAPLENLDWGQYTRP